MNCDALAQKLLENYVTCVNVCMWTHSNSMLSGVYFIDREKAKCF